MVINWLIVMMMIMTLAMGFPKSSHDVIRGQVVLLVSPPLCLLAMFDGIFKAFIENVLKFSISTLFAIMSNLIPFKADFARHGTCYAKNIKDCFALRNTHSQSFTTTRRIVSLLCVGNPSSNHVDFIRILHEC